MMRGKSIVLAADRWRLQREDKMKEVKDRQKGILRHVRAKSLVLKRDLPERMKYDGVTRARVDFSELKNPYNTVAVVGFSDLECEASAKSVAVCARRGQCCELIKSGRNDKKQLTFYMDYIMINRYRTFVRIRHSAFVDVKRGRNMQLKISDYWISGARKR